MNFFDRLNVYFYHNERQRKWPSNKPKILGWRDEASQHARFDVIANQADFNGKSVLDLGCGYGDLKPFLDERYHLANYTGIDQHKAFIASAKLRDLANARFIHADFARAKLAAHDIIVACGSLNYASSQPDYLFTILQGMHQLARETVIVNLLDKAQFPSDKLLRGYHPQQVLSFCKKLCPTSSLITGYANDDFTIVMNKLGR